ncbi:hypothetical protein PanWU01x14_063550, partial [Parasponia andersonii]
MSSGKKGLSHMKIGEDIMEDVTLISSHIQSFYKDLFTEPQVSVIDYSGVQEIIPNLVFSLDNLELCRIPNEEEIRLMVFDIDASSASGPNGFSGKFFCHCWDIISQDVVSTVQQFFHSDSLIP